MKKSNTFLSIVFWVISGAVFATGAILFSPRADRQDNTKAVVPQQVPIALEQR